MASNADKLFDAQQQLLDEFGNAFGEYRMTIVGG
jgi:hypothetical protein